MTLNTHELRRTLAISIFSTNERFCSSGGTSPIQFPFTRAKSGILPFLSLLRQVEQTLEHFLSKTGPGIDLLGSDGELLNWHVIEGPQVSGISKL